MTEDELIQREIDLDIKVTPEIEDAFHFLYGLEKNGEDITEEQLNCGKHLRTSYPNEDVKKAVVVAYKMIDNIKKYGVACAAWA